jgi:uncharacterized membrane protein
MPMTEHARGMRPLKTTALLLALAPAAAAEPALPFLAEVVGVAAGDVLNVREGPDVSAPAVGALAPDAAGVEVVGLDPTGRWGLVNAGERAGWAAMRHLGPAPDVWVPGQLPPSLACFGTEPFWSLRSGAGGATFATPDAGERALALTAVDSGIAGDPRRALVAEAGGLRLAATIAPVRCSDGMSDRAYGLELLGILEEAGAPRLLAGCCSIAPAR